MTMEAEGVVLERIEVELEPDCDVDGLVTGYLSDELLFDVLDAKLVVEAGTSDLTALELDAVVEIMVGGKSVELELVLEDGFVRVISVLILEYLSDRPDVEDELVV